jgi:glutaredoxin-like protein NrdH
MVTVYTTPSCVQCEQTKKYLDKNNVPYSVVDLSVNLEALEKVRNLGFAAAPVVMTENESWFGFRIDKLKKLTEGTQAA